MSKTAEITAIVQEISGKGSAPEPDESLFESGYLDSFAIVDLVSKLEERFGFKIPDGDLNPRKFGSVERIESYLESKGV